MPPCESRIRFPEVVEISLAPSTPILMLSAVISVEVIAWLNWTVPDTLCASEPALPIVVLPLTWNVPAANVLPVCASTVNVAATAKSSVTSSVPVMSTFPPKLPSSTTMRSSPTCKSRPIPAPPPTMRVPVAEFVAFVVSNKF